MVKESKKSGRGPFNWLSDRSKKVRSAGLKFGTEPVKPFPDKSKWVRLVKDITSEGNAPVSPVSDRSITDKLASSERRLASSSLSLWLGVGGLDRTTPDTLASSPVGHEVKELPPTRNSMRPVI